MPKGIKYTDRVRPAGASTEAPAIRRLGIGDTRRLGGNPSSAGKMEPDPSPPAGDRFKESSNAVRLPRDSGDLI
jgi:hypothetical protein